MPIKKGSELCKDKADIGLIALAVMGENLILNMANHGFTVCCYNRTTSKVRLPLSLCLRAVCTALTRISRWTTFWRAAPRANWNDTNRRDYYLQGKGILFIGTGVSGGEEGALIGPSIIARRQARLLCSEPTATLRHFRSHCLRSTEAWPHAKEIFQKHLRQGSEIRSALL